MPPQRNEKQLIFQMEKVSSSISEKRVIVSTMILPVSDLAHCAGTSPKKDLTQWASKQ